MRSLHNNLRQRKSTKGATRTSPSLPLDRTSHIRGRKRRRPEDAYKSYMLVLITTSIWLFVFIHWPKSDQSGLKNKFYPDGDKFHSMLRKGSVSKSIHDGDEDGGVGRNVRMSNGLINGSSSSASSIISSSSSSILMPQRSNVEKAFQTNSRQNQNNIMVKGNQIICSDGSKGVQNDDYCDCSDGLDELQTSACSHILVHSKSFACADGISFIFPSRVKDGVDDCPDGSDEM